MFLLVQFMLTSPGGDPSAWERVGFVMRVMKICQVCAKIFALELRGGAGDFTFQCL